MWRKDLILSDSKAYIFRPHDFVEVTLIEPDSQICGAYPVDWTNVGQNLETNSLLAQQKQTTRGFWFRMVPRSLKVAHILALYCAWLVAAE